MGGFAHIVVCLNGIILYQKNYSTLRFYRVVTVPEVHLKKYVDFEARIKIIFFF